MSPREIADRAWRTYRDRLGTVLEPAHRGRFVAIDVQSGDHFLGDTDVEATREAEAGRPDGVFFLIRVGYPTTYRVGARWTSPS